MHYREPTAEELSALRLISEQVAIPLDQLARFLGVDVEQARRNVTELEQIGCLRQRAFLAHHEPWVWLTSRGERLSGTGFAALRVPTVRWLTHRRAINEVRLYLRGRAPEARWVSERALRRLVDRNRATPDAVLLFQGERHAIEVELSQKSRQKLNSVIASHCNRYDAVLYFCSPKTRRLLDEVSDTKRWPKLIVRDVPGLEPLLANRSRGFGQPLRDARRPQRVRWGRRRKHARPAEAWERRVLILIAEQAAVPLDQLARFLACDADRAAHVAAHLCDAGFARRAQLLADEPEWIWLTAGGTRVSTTGFRPYMPAPGALKRLRAINEVRLRIEEGAPQARWIGWRTLRRELRGSGQIPNAIVEIDDERHAIELELTRKKEKDAAALIARRSAHYDAVICFCTPQTHRCFARLAAKNHWPKLVIRRLPTASPVAAASPARNVGRNNSPQAPPGAVASPSDPSPSSSPPLCRRRWSPDEAVVDLLCPKATGTSTAPPPGSRNLSWQPETNPERSEVGDDLWAQLRPLIPKDERRGSPANARRMPDRTALSGILYVARNPINWNQLPHELGYGSGMTCYERLRRWQRAGIWAKVQPVLEAKLHDGDQIAWHELGPQQPSDRREVRARTA